MSFIPDFGKYAIFVWTCYWVSVFTLLSLTFLTFFQNSKHRK